MENLCIRYWDSMPANPLPTPSQLIREPARRAALGFSVLAHRPRRVVLLLIAIAVMSGVDLYLTLLYVTHTGLNEMNPLARAMMEYQSPAILAVWKATTVAVAVGILLLIRRQRSAEWGAWAGCMVLGLLMLHWASFIEQTKHMTLEVAQAMGENDPTWVMIGARVEAGAHPTRTMID